MQALIKLLIELGPLVIFFVVNGKAGILVATAAFMAATVAAMVASYLLRHTVPVMLWVSAIVVTIFGGATLYFENETFIKLKPTIIYVMFAVVLLAAQCPIQAAKEPPGIRAERINGLDHVGDGVRRVVGRCVAG